MSKERYNFIKDDNQTEILGTTIKDDLDIKSRIYNKGFTTYIMFDKRYDIKLPERFHKSYIEDKMIIKHDVKKTKEEKKSYTHNL